MSFATKGTDVAPPIPRSESDEIATYILSENLSWLFCDGAMASRVSRGKLRHVRVLGFFVAKKHSLFPSKFGTDTSRHLVFRWGQVFKKDERHSSGRVRVFPGIPAAKRPVHVARVDTRLLLESEGLLAELPGFAYFHAWPG